MTINNPISLHNSMRVQSTKQTNKQLQQPIPTRRLVAAIQQITNYKLGPN